MNGLLLTMNYHICGEGGFYFFLTQLQTFTQNSYPLFQVENGSSHEVKEALDLCLVLTFPLKCFKYATKVFAVRNSLI